MQRILSAQLHAHIGESVRLAGWVHRRRLLKSVAFLILRDRAGLSQVVVTDPGVRAQIESAGEETAVEVTGKAVANAAAPAGVEVVEPLVRVLGAPAEPPPFDLFRPELGATLPTQLDHASLSLRHATRASALRLSAAAVAGFRSTLDALGFVEVHTPKIVASSTESGANVFAIDYFGRPAFLAQSPQFYKQMMVGVFERVYEVGPVFRAEPHETGRHLAQYTSLDAELGFVGDHRDVMAVLTEVIRGMVAATGLPAALPDEFPAVHFTEALRIAGGWRDPHSGPVDLAPADERAVGEWALREHGSDFVFVTGYPMAKRPFYTHPDPDRPGYTNGFDLLFRGVELVTGGQRLHRYEDYVAALAARGEPLAPYASYVEAFRHGMPPHGGFAIGLERFVARLTGAGNVREVTAFPRDRHRLTP
ncbi:aspartate--tRNA(Asn) ligase [Phytohabitans sp. ZYX-F-186]|uniref:Aspartate--tRNA(Asp/Asn) ligase n=1 Tax=Phytohabitans maris TaxID=3071409 RepID=A0ABU0Z865_9ACTN|nr:aspartate--tRNA(Asn) ligase [Phytohabitans sp. ZYX-F-186]MDQ7903238.1 aspartate--tRNA(Asn) ligase [Phytohabitans sp. ZYX-F-186]